ncbi:MAG: radical SAM family heme chaperone HemW [Gammaproteobacteria bacterium]|nr:radical SAM family heme chaperone HemW [Gammaproteobacteria bacterium]
MAMPPLALYLHLPWCVRKCPYCDFNSVALRESLPEQDYVTALLADLDAEAEVAGDRDLCSIYLGGGTPSLFTPDAIARLLDGVRERLAIAPDAEITIEVNPGTKTPAALAGYRTAGINRLSLGVQSLRDALLVRIGRIHDAATAQRTLHDARTAGFGNINVDLMFGLPGDDGPGAIEDLERVLDFAPEHVSWYQLTLEPGTEFGRRPPALPAEDAIAALHERGLELLAARGYRRYEVSAFARPGRASAHNLNYWQFGDYLGIGAGAHGKRTLADGTLVRTVKSHAPTAYLRRAGSPETVTETLVTTPAERMLEFLLNALRLCDGFAPELFVRRTGLPIERLWPLLETAQGAGLLEVTAARIRPTTLGQRYLNDLLLLFVDVPTEAPTPAPASPCRTTTPFRPIEEMPQ